MRRRRAYGCILFDRLSALRAKREREQGAGRALLKTIEDLVHRRTILNRCAHGLSPEYMQSSDARTRLESTPIPEGE